MNAAAVLTSAALLLHSLLGCCWHHVHEPGDAAHSAHLEHDHASDHGDQEGQHPAEQHCQAARCAFITTPGPDVDYSAASVALASLDAFFASAAAQPVVQMTAWSSHAPPVPAAEVQPLMLRI